MELFDSEMCEEAKEKLQKYYWKEEFKRLLDKTGFKEIALYLYLRLVAGSEKDTTYKNDLYLLKRVGNSLTESKLPLTIKNIVSVVQEHIDSKSKEGVSMTANTVTLYDR